MGYNESTTNTLKQQKDLKPITLTLHLEQLEKKKIEPKGNRRKEIKNMKAGGKQKIRKSIGKSNQSLLGSLKRLAKLKAFS